MFDQYYDAPDLYSSVEYFRVWRLEKKSRGMNRKK